jgi:hypothetical protein
LSIPRDVVASVSTGAATSVDKLRGIAGVEDKDGCSIPPLWDDARDEEAAATKEASGATFALFEYVALSTGDSLKIVDDSSVLFDTTGAAITADASEESFRFDPINSYNAKYNIK